MKIMGIVNLTPDSFSDGGKISSFDDIDSIIATYKKNGVSYIDIGGESTKPGAEIVSLQEERNRVIDVVKYIKSKNLDMKISIDTYKSEIAEESLQLGADMINDISALTFDEKMVDIVSDYNCELTLMHIKGTPRNMQKNPTYNSVVDEVLSFLEKQANFAIKRGVSPEKIWLDPGFGFGKTFQHNLELLQNIDKIKELGFKVLAGISRKTFLGQTLPYETFPKERDASTIASSIYFLQHEVDIVRVHAVEANYQALKTFQAIMG